MLIHFLVDVHAAAPRASIRLRQASAMIRSIVVVAGVDEFVTVEDPFSSWLD
ncbi:hypothetical protein AB0M36_04600 [Actinoplanes sp. NPDC051346]|uniref:hypothetical protein n=1 Tax=Actinoplanes sp. NPDC051346 TaxID=3155048 RepID=UPI0034377E62